MNDDEFEQTNIGGGLSKKTAHPNSIKLLAEEYYWDCTDENSPFGNDTGADTLRHFVQWRKENPSINPMEFVEELAPAFDCPLEDWKQLNASNLQSDFGRMYVLTTGNEIAIATAFGQLVVEGKVDKDVSDFAKVAIAKEKDFTVRWVDPEERKQRLDQMLEVLSKI